jgi:ATP-dependent RecD-like DNA helicase SH3 domain
VLNPASDEKVERFGWTFAAGDKVMQIENDYDKEVYNGDIGTINRVDPVAGEVVVTFDGHSVTYGFGELDMLVPAYAANEIGDQRELIMFSSARAQRLAGARRAISPDERASPASFHFTSQLAIGRERTN